MSLRTPFVHLYVRDLSKGDNAEFQDYGLYTQVEQLNKTGMKNHGMDSNGQLYKINSFEFYRHEDVIKKRMTQLMIKQHLKSFWKSKAIPDHTKLINMLTALNDNSQPIDSIFE